MKPSRSAPSSGSGLTVKIFAALFGAFFGLSLLKFGNPPIMEQYVSSPTNIYELLLGYPWPIAWAYRSMAGLAVLGLIAGDWRKEKFRWFLLVPLAWFLWQCLASAQSIRPDLSRPTLLHFLACLSCFYLGFFTLSRLRNLGAFWIGLLTALVLLVSVGWEQHFGGLDESRRFFYLYLYPKMHQIPPEYFKKLLSTRIFGTMFYPNALAGALLLLLPLALGVVNNLRQALTPPARWFVLSIITFTGLACLYWSGSKGGWLLMLLLSLLALLRIQSSKALKIGVVSVALLAGTAGFFWKYSAFFEKGATSVSARFDYWRAAVEITKNHPLLGTGPGTFQVPYAQLKRPESEMARLTHNDYLEQACDSGLPGFLGYALFLMGTLVLTAPRDWARPGPIDWLPFSIWLGTLGVALQALAEFWLYLPAIAWPAFALLGLLLGWRQRTTPLPNPSVKPIDKCAAPL